MLNICSTCIYKFLHFQFKYLFQSFSLLSSSKGLESCVLEEKDLRFQLSGQVEMEVLYENPLGTFVVPWFL